MAERPQVAGIREADYRDVIDRSLRAASKDRGPADSRVSVIRVCGNVTAVAEDNGEFYRVWMNRADQRGVTAEVRGFRDLPWGGRKRAGG